MKPKYWMADVVQLNKNKISNKRFEQLLAELWEILLNDICLPKTELAPVKSFEIPFQVSRLNKKGD